MIRAAIAGLAFTACIAPAALAGDAATLGILGFSAGGKLFTFEEYGVQDGSGFPFANRFYIDTATDSFIAGTPVRVRIDDETASVATARAQAKTAGETVVPDAELEANRGFTAGFNAITELSADPHAMTVNPRPIFPPIDDPLSIRLEEIALPANEPCAILDGPIMGFRLISVGTGPNGVDEILHEDSRVPASRGCPTGYRIGAIQTFGPAAGVAAYAVVIAVERLGFEGPDHRWLAVTRRTEN